MHHHAPIKHLQTEKAFVGCAARDVDDCNPQAHGNIVRIDHCRCGAERHININQSNVESSGWIREREQ